MINNINNIKKIIKDNKFLMKLFKIIMRIKFFALNFSFEFCSFFRSKGIHGEKYLKLKKMQNIHEGERCFIIATGPSLKMNDIEKLEKEITISMNSICLIFDKTAWRPTYYGIQDEHVYKKLEKSITSSDLKNVLISNSISKKYNTKEAWIKYPLNVAYHEYENGFNQNYFAKFSDNSFRSVYDGYSVTYSMIQLAAYMGFKEIFLLGADTNYSKDKNKQHFVESGHYDPTFINAGIRMIEAYKVAKDYADKNNINIYNATRGGMLEVFQRVDLDEVLGLKGDNDVS